ncbi:MAG TPA: Rieske (2Fe-2S) protein [Pseudonocardia sp.]|uniref:QcrA and Rieske domain-containing protein n=1 Tax=Pseudonocardia sp. TaxID=60912 RepID=UPI002F42198C
MPLKPELLPPASTAPSDVAGAEARAADHTVLTRRSVVASVGAAAGVATLGLGLLGCGSSPGPAPSAPPTSNSAPPAAGTGAATPPPAATSPVVPHPVAHGPHLAGLEAIGVGQSVVAHGAGGRTLIVTKTGPDTAVAHSAICTHMGCTVAPAGTHLQCPCHGSAFNAATGAVVHGPASKPLPAFAVTVDHGEVYQQ